jgi:HD superfamily phosphohydrolase YqeK
MSLLDEIIFLSDFIEEGRVYEESRKLYEWVFSEIDLSAGEPSEAIIHRACIAEIDSTVKHLKEKNKEINPKTLLTRRALLSKIKEV